MVKMSHTKFPSDFEYTVGGLSMSVRSGYDPLSEKYGTIFEIGYNSDLQEGSAIFLKENFITRARLAHQEKHPDKTLNFQAALAGNNRLCFFITAIPTPSGADAQEKVEAVTATVHDVVSAMTKDTKLVEKLEQINKQQLEEVKRREQEQQKKLLSERASRMNPVQLALADDPEAKNMFGEQQWKNYITSKRVESLISQATRREKTQACK